MLPTVLSSINGLLRSQYSLAFNPGDVRDGKQHKIKVSVDVNGDGILQRAEMAIGGDMTTSCGSINSEKKPLSLPK